MTVDEAKKKKCFVTFNTPPSSVSNHTHWMCIADECMAWREAKVPVEFDGETETFKYETHGYCGMVRND